MSFLATHVKQPIEELDYDISYDDFLTQSDELAKTPAPDITITPSSPDGLQKGAVNVTSRWLKIWLTGGVAGEVYKVEVTVHTNEGRVRQDEFIVSVEDF